LFKWGWEGASVIAMLLAARMGEIKDVSIEGYDNFDERLICAKRCSL